MDEKAYADIQEFLDGVEAPKFFFCILQKTIFENMNEQMKKYECLNEFIDLHQILTNPHENDFIRIFTQLLDKHGNGVQISTGVKSKMKKILNNITQLSKQLKDDNDKYESNNQLQFTDKADRNLSEASTLYVILSFTMNDYHINSVKVLPLVQIKQQKDREYKVYNVKFSSTQKDLENFSRKNKTISKVMVTKNKVAEEVIKIKKIKNPLQSLIHSNSAKQKHNIECKRTTTKRKKRLNGYVSFFSVFYCDPLNSKYKQSLLKQSFEGDITITILINDTLIGEWKLQDFPIDHHNHLQKSVTILIMKRLPNTFTNTLENEIDPVLYPKIQKHIAIAGIMKLINVSEGIHDTFSMILLFIRIQNLVLSLEFSGKALIIVFNVPSNNLLQEKILYKRTKFNGNLKRDIIFVDPGVNEYLSTKLIKIDRLESHMKQLKPEKEIFLCDFPSLRVISQKIEIEESYICKAIKNIDKLPICLETLLKIYNKEKLEFVFFYDVQKYLFCIYRIIKTKRNSALLVDVDKSDKKYLPLLIVCRYLFSQIIITKSYRKIQLRNFINEIYNQSEYLNMLSIFFQSYVQQSLMSLLSIEKNSQAESKSTLIESNQRFVGCASFCYDFLFHCNLFNFNFNKQPFVEESQERNIPITIGYNIHKCLVVGKLINNLALQKVITALNSTRYPILINPQEQALTWFKNNFKETFDPQQKFIILLNKRFTKTLKKNMQENENVLLFDKIQNEVDTVLDPVPETRNIVKRKTKLINKRERKVSDNFNAFTRISNSKFSVYFSDKTLSINSNVNQIDCKKEKRYKPIDIQNLVLSCCLIQMIIIQLMYNTSLQFLLDIGEGLIDLFVQEQGIFRFLVMAVYLILIKNSLSFLSKITQEPLIIKSKKWLIFLIISLLIIKSNVNAVTITVSAAGGSIQDTINSASNGDIIKLDPGEYSITTKITINKQIELHGAQYGKDAKGRSTAGENKAPSEIIPSDPNESTLILAAGTRMIEIQDSLSHVLIDGLSFTSKNNYKPNSASEVIIQSQAGGQDSSENITIQNCIFRNLQSDAGLQIIRFHNGNPNERQDTVVKNNCFRDCTNKKGYLIGIHFSGKAKKQVVEGNLFTRLIQQEINTQALYIELWGGIGEFELKQNTIIGIKKNDIGIYAKQDSTIQQNNIKDCQYGIQTSTNKVYIFNQNVLTNNKYGIKINTKATDVIIKYNDIYGNEIKDIDNLNSKETNLQLNYFKDLTTLKLSTKVTIQSKLEMSSLIYCQKIPQRCHYCPSPNEFNVNGECQSSCPADNSVESTNPKTCLTKENCYLLNKYTYNQECIEDCKATINKQIYDGVCIKDCQAINKYQFEGTCVQNCKTTKNMYQFDGVCVKDCQAINKYQFEGTCVQNCKTTKNMYQFDGVCVKDCQTTKNKYLFDGVCVEDCQKTKNKYLFDGVCVENCTKTNKKYLFDGVCVENCTKTNKEHHYNGVCFISCPSPSYNYNDQSKCLKASELPDKLFIDESTRQFLNKSACLQKLKFIYLSANDRKCVNDCKETSKLLNHKNECVKECPKSFFNNKKEGQCLCPTGYFLDSNYECKTIEKVGKSVSCSENKYLHKGQCLDTCPESLYVLNQSCVQQCEKSQVHFSKKCFNTCPKNTYLYNKECFKTCPGGLKSNTTHCVQELNKDEVSNQEDSNQNDSNLEDLKLSKGNLTFQIQPLTTKYHYDIIFNHQLTNKSIQQCDKSLNVTIEGVENYIPIFNISKQITKNQETTFKLRLNFSNSNQFFNKEMVISFPNSTIMDVFGISLSTEQQAVTLQHYFIPTSQELIMEFLSNYYSKGTFWGFIIIGVLMFLLRKSLRKVWDTFNFFQMLYYLIFTGTKYPYMLIIILDNLALVNQSDHDFFRQFLTSDNLLNSKSPEQFYIKGYNTTFFIVNIGALIFILIYNLCLILLSKLILYLYSCISKVNLKDEENLNCFIKFILQRKEDMQWDHNIQQLHCAYIQLSIFAMLSLYNMDFNTKFTILSSILGIINVIFVIVYPILMLKLRRRPVDGQFILKKEDRYTVKFFKKEYYYFESVITYRKLVFTILVVFLHNYNRPQICSITILNLGYLIFLYKTKPYSSESKNNHTILSELLFQITLFLMVLYTIFYEQLSVNWAKFFGWAMVITICIILAVEFKAQFISISDKQKKSQVSPMKKTQEEDIVKTVDITDLNQVELSSRQQILHISDNVNLQNLEKLRRKKPRFEWYKGKRTRIRRKRKQKNKKITKLENPTQSVQIQDLKSEERKSQLKVEHFEKLKTKLKFLYKGKQTGKRKSKREKNQKIINIDKRKSQLKVQNVDKVEKLKTKPEFELYKGKQTKERERKQMQQKFKLRKDEIQKRKNISKETKKLKERKSKIIQKSHSKDQKSMIIQKEKKVKRTVKKSQISSIKKTQQQDSSNNQTLQQDQKILQLQNKAKKLQGKQTRKRKSNNYRKKVIQKGKKVSKEIKGRKEDRLKIIQKSLLKAKKSLIIQKEIELTKEVNLEVETKEKKSKLSSIKKTQQQDSSNPEKYQVDQRIFQLENPSKKLYGKQTRRRKRKQKEQKVKNTKKVISKRKIVSKEIQGLLDDKSKIIKYSYYKGQNDMIIVDLETKEKKSQISKIKKTQQQDRQNPRKYLVDHWKFQLENPSKRLQGQQPRKTKTKQKEQKLKNTQKVIQKRKIISKEIGGLQEDKLYKKPYYKVQKIKKIRKQKEVPKEINLEILEKPDSKAQKSLKKVTKRKSKSKRKLKNPNKRVKKNTVNVISSCKSQLFTSNDQRRNRD